MGKIDITFKNESDVRDYYEQDPDNNKIVLFEGVVYHVGEYMSTHPGGESYIEENLGTNIEEMWEEHEHTKSALKVLHALPIVGQIEGSDTGGSTSEDAAVVQKKKSPNDIKDIVNDANE